MHAGRRIREAVAGYAIPIVRLIGESYGRHTIQQAWREFTLRSGAPFTADDPHAELFFSWLSHTWTPRAARGDKLEDPTLYGVAPTRAYLARNAPRLDPLLRRYLESCLLTPVSFHEIIDCTPCVGFKAWNVLTGAEVEVDEGLASATVSDGDIVFARIVPIDGIYTMDAISPYSFPADYKPRLLEHCRYGNLRQPAEVSVRRLYFTLLESLLRGS